MHCRPSPAKSRDFELSWVSVGICYQNSIKRQCLFCGWLVKNVFLPGDQEGLFKLAIQLRNFFNWVIYNTATGYVLLVYLTNI
jgi:hypothetical protein